jgi:integrase
MASIVNDPNGRKRILFMAPDGKRKTIRLGKIDRKTAEGVCRQVEHLLSARLSGQPIPQETAMWLRTIGGPLQDKLARVGLIEASDAMPTLAQWCQDYLASRSDLAPATLSRMNDTARLLVEHFGTERRLDQVTASDAEAFIHALEKRYAPNTVRRVTGWCRQFFAAAVKSEVISRNPFQGLAATVRPNRSRSHYVTPEEIQALIEAAPDVEWRLILALCRYAGLRFPSEVMALRWGDVLWDRNRMNVANIKTRRKTGEAFRVVPLFPELRPYLEDAFALATPGQEFVITRWRKRRCSMRKMLQQIAHRAGVKLWPKPFVNMRASAATDLVQRFQHYVVTAWLGHTREIAEAHYWQVTEEHYSQAAQKAAQQGAASDGKEVSPCPNAPSESSKNAAPCHLTQSYAMCKSRHSMTSSHPENSEKTGSFPESGAHSGALDPYLTRLIELWPRLTDRQRRRLLRLAERIATVS